MLLVSETAVEMSRRSSLSQLPVSRDCGKKAKYSPIGQPKKTDSHDFELTNNCNSRKAGEKCKCTDKQERSGGDMAFSAIYGGGRGGNISKNRVIQQTDDSNIELQNDSDSCSRCRKSSTSSQNGSDTVKLNVGGTVFETYVSTLKKLRTCKLSRSYEMKKYYREDKGDYFLDRDPQVFSVVLNYLRTGELHIPTFLCGPILQREFEHWGIDELDIERCCWQPYNTWKTQNLSLEKLESDRKKSTTQRDLKCDRNSPSRWKRVRAIVWNVLQDPTSSCGAKIYAWISILFVFLSIFSFCAETHPAFKVDRGTLKSFEALYSIQPEATYLTEATVTIPNTLNSTNSNQTADQRVTHPALKIIDLCCVTFFTVEFICRFVFCPAKLQFITTAQNIIDILAILPDYVEFIIYIINPSGEKMPFMEFIVILRMLRLCRIFRLIRHVPGLWILLYTLKASSNELLLMFVFLLIGMIVFASLIHFAESDKGFDNIPIGFWWSVVTMTTVGYGDKFPQTAYGYIVGSLCAVSGLLMIAFTVPIIVSNFVLYYTHVQYGLGKIERTKRNAFEEEEQGLVSDDESETECIESKEILKVKENGNGNHVTDGNYNKVSISSEDNSPV